MHHPDKNSFLQLVVAMNPRVINKAVDQAMQRETDIYTKPYAANRLSSMQPSLFAPHVDITRAHVGFERTGLRLLVRELHSSNYLVQLQAIHSVMDRVSRSSYTYIKQSIIVHQNLKEHSWAVFRTPRTQNAR